MNNRITTLISVLLVIGCFWFVRFAQAVIPPPDGGYPGGNTAEGQKALLSLTTGTYNTAIGYLSLRSNTEGGFNTGVGSGALLSNNSGRNTATGAAALLSNTTGPANTANGALALLSNTEGGYNTAVGDRALQVHTAGDRNTAIGASALLNDTIGTNNTATGAAALFSNTEGFFNTAMGDSALLSNVIGVANTAVGPYALGDNVSGSDNTAIGDSAGVGNTSGSFNTYLGLGAFGVDGENDTARIGDSAFGVACFIGGIWTQSGGSQPVYVNSDGKLGALVSSRRFKDEIKPMEQASEAIYGLKPVSFRYKPEIEPTRPVGFGLIAEEVEAVSPHLVTCDKNGNANSVRYDAVNAMLLNEFLKEHRRVEQLERRIEEQDRTAAQLRKEMQTVVAHAKEQDAKIQRVSGQLAAASPFRGELEMSTTTRNIVLNNP